tara:strand:+ start:149 stop:367 length:219 start_codon:yes stop_codon:yes gene_type:complete
MMSVDKEHIRRVTDEKATELFHEGWRYVPKSVWKEKVRDLEKTHDEVQDGKLISKKSNKMSKAQKRHAKKSK